MTRFDRVRILAFGVIASVLIPLAIGIGSMRVAWWIARGSPESHDRRYRKRAGM